MAQVTDDFGNVFRRGAVTSLPVRDWEMLSTGPASRSFLFLGPETIELASGGCCTPAATTGAPSAVSAAG
jgi:hypothetical protein